MVGSWLKNGLKKLLGKGANMGGDKQEQVLEPRTSTREGRDKFGKLRFQNYDDGRIHIHDDKKSLVFEYKSGRSFQLALSKFIEEQSKYNVDDKLLIIGESAGEKAADVLLKRLDGGWDIDLVKAGSIKEEVIIIADPLITFLDDFIHRI